MKISDAIRNVKLVFMNFPDIASEETIESFEIAVAAMEKQDPMKPTYDHRYAEMCCSVCGSMMGGGEEQPDYCPECGQKLDWED